MWINLSTSFLFSVFLNIRWDLGVERFFLIKEEKNYWFMTSILLYMVSLWLNFGIKKCLRIELIIDGNKTIRIFFFFFYQGY